MNRGMNLRISILSLLVILAAALFSFACAHDDLGPMDTTRIEEPWDDGSAKSVPPISAVLVQAGVHNIDVAFNTPMNAKTVDAVLTNENGEEVQFTNQSWSADRYTLHFKGPFKFCHIYNMLIAPGAAAISSATLDDELLLSVIMSKNPMDVDDSSSCTADVAISPVFTDELDGVLATGDAIMAGGIFEVKRPADLDRIDVFYIDKSAYYDNADRMIILPELTRGNPAGMAKLFSRQQGSARSYALGIWDTYDPIYELATSSIIHDIPLVSSRELRGPFDAGDFDGDGARDLMLSIEMPNPGGGFYQNVFLLRGPVFHGSGLKLTDIADVNTIIRSSGGSLAEPVSVGDVDGDDNDDFAIVEHQISDMGVEHSWKVWLFHGRSDVNMIFDQTEVDKIAAHPKGEIVDIDAGDVNGDGKSDIIVAQVERRYSGSEYVSVNLRIGIFFGKADMDGLSMAWPDSTLIVITSNDTSANIRVLGDVNGDGYDDLGLHVTEKNKYGGIKSSKIYLFMGRDQLFESYHLGSRFLPRANAIIDVTGYEGVYWKDNFRDPKIGDVDNDGYYDFMIMSDDGTERTAYWFFGENSYTQQAIMMDLDDADIIWTFR